MSGSFPMSTPDWCNRAVIRRNTLAPRSYFFLYDTLEDAMTGDLDKSASLNLSGTWKFHHANGPFDAPKGFAAVEYDTSTWADIQVPGIWQLQGWGHPHYTNVAYPFFVDPPHVPYHDNQTGSYVRRFTVPTHFADSQIRLRFEGVDSAFHVYINGKEIGYSQGSRNPAEFDITSVVNQDAENVLAVRVYQFCDGSYLEDQDQWRFSGIFRDVYLHAFPKAHIKDFQVQTILDDEYADADLKVKIDVTEGGEELSLKVLDPTGQEIAGEVTQPEASLVNLTVKISNPSKWTAETPTLYKLILFYGGKFIVQNVGFRRIEIKNGIYLVNGQRIVFRGANRHEHHPIHGRAVPYDYMKQDLLLMKRHNINALRTCHQPSDPRLYALADQLGIWVMDEADLECHGFWTVDEMALSADMRTKSFEEKKAILSDSGRWTSDNPVWKNQYVDRATQLCMRDKNHPCVVMWSLGNEAFYGRNFQAMYDEIKAIDDSRPIHYEGDFKAQTADLFSQMYPKVDDIIKFAEEPNFTKPLVLCEFVHAMGNGPGNIKEYIDAFYKHPRLQGGWVWEWANHGLIKKDTKTGEDFYAYGGDFGDEPNDYNFILDGVLFSNHTPTPGLTEYKKAIEPVQIQGGTDGKVEITNRYDTISLDHLKCVAFLISDGHKESLGEVSIPSGIAPHSTTELKTPSYNMSDLSGEVFLQFHFSLRHSTSWADGDHLICSSQIQVQGPEQRQVSSTKSTAPTVEETGSSLTITSATSKFTVSLASGTLTSWQKNNIELIHSALGPQLTFYRALTDNDRPQDGRDWTTTLVNLVKQHVRSATWTTKPAESAMIVTVTSKYAPPTLSWSIDTTTTYTFFGNGSWRIHCTGNPTGLNLPPTLPRIGFEFALPSAFTNVSWFGRGPGECYKDKKLSQNFGNWSASVDELFVDYEFPQETSNRTDVRWVKVASTPSVKSAAGGTVTALASKFGEVLSTAAASVPNPVLSTGTAATSTSTLPKNTTDSENAGSSVSKAAAEPPSITAHFGTQEGFSFMASHYTSRDLDDAKHPHELRKMKKDYVILRLDADHHGLGTGSCGPKTLEKYALKTKQFEFEIDFE